MNSGSKNGSLKEFYENEDFDKMITFLRDVKLESLAQNNILSKTFNLLENKADFNKIIEILRIIAKYKISIFEYEMKEGIRILINSRKLHEVLDIIDKMISNNKILDEYVIISTITSCINSGLIEKCFDMIGKYYNLNKNVSHTFWQTSIEGFLRAKENEYANRLLRLYPIKYSYSESLWKNVIISNMDDEHIMTVFEIFIEKYDSRGNNDEFRAFENIFNIFVEELANSYSKIGQNKIEAIYDVIIKKQINIKENVLEKFLVKVLESNLSNFEVVENFILKSDCLLTPKIIEKIILTYSKENDNLAIFTILKMSKCKKIPVPYDTLNIPHKIFKELLKFIMENTELNFEDSFYSSLSEDNKYYVLKNFKCSNAKVINIGEEVEKDNFEIKEDLPVTIAKIEEKEIEDDFVIY